MAIFSNILKTIGNTPVVHLNAFSKNECNIFAKLEAFNPMGSVKDRMALEIIEQAERSGELQPGQTVIEATSGNTGIGLAMVCASKGYPLVVTMAENFSIERRKLLRFLGAKVVLTPASEKASGMLAKAEELAEKHGYYLCRQFENKANSDAHLKTTAPELVEDFKQANLSLDYFVTGSGTGGTLSGIAQGLKTLTPNTKIIVAEPDNAPMLASGIKQERTATGKPISSHTKFRPHLMQGWSPDFISRLTEQALSSKMVDEVISVSGARSLALSREMALKEGIFAGISSGATLVAALELAERAPRGSNIVCLLPDTGERYLSTPLFETIGVDMDEHELAISNSTPSCQFYVTETKDAQHKHKPTNTIVTGISSYSSDDSEVVDLVETQIASVPVLLYSLEWCEYCWAARKLLDAINVKYESIDLDSVKYQKDDLGGRIRTVLKSKLKLSTIPQIFIEGQHIGGASELLNAMNTGELFRLLRQAEVDFNDQADVNTLKMLPNWVHPRISAH